jgi:hypothetical protein
MGQTYRLLKIVTQPAIPEQIARLGNDRAPIMHAPKPSSAVTFADPGPSTNGSSRTELF